MTFVKNFSEINKSSVGEAGGKGASLGEMTEAGIPVPPGFVVLAPAFDIFLKTAGLEAKVQETINAVDYGDVSSVDAASAKIRDLILQEKFPEDISREVSNSFLKLGAEFVAVRSSATAEDGSQDSWAGELESYLNTSEKNLLENVKKCWSSLFTPRAMVYRNEKGLTKSHVSVAVVVQKMVQSEVAGVAFTTHPVTEDPNQMIIEGALGLGEMVVSGQVTPDSFVVNKTSKHIEETMVNDQEEMMIRSEDGNKKVSTPSDKKSAQKLSNEHVLELAEICSRIENHYGFPCDIEWGFEKGKFYIVQSRPITTLGAK